VLPAAGSPGFQPTIDGARLSVPPGESFVLRGSGVHTRNGDSITLRFRAPESDSGSLQFGFDADTHEHARVECNFERSVISLSTSDWTIPQPVASAPMFLAAGESVVVVIEKSEAGGNLVKNADIGVHLDGQQVLAADDLDLLPEMAVAIGVQGTTCVVKEFLHSGPPSAIPEYLHLGGWQNRCVRLAKIRSQIALSSFI